MLLAGIHVFVFQFFRIISVLGIDFYCYVVKLELSYTELHDADSGLQTILEFTIYELRFEKLLGFQM